MKFNNTLIMPPKTPMRAYFFGNMYLSPIQQGIQALHVVTEMYTADPTNVALLDWARDWKTVELRNGGFQSNLKKIEDALAYIKQYYPSVNLCYGSFREEDDALNGALTCVGFVTEQITREDFDSVDLSNGRFSGSSIGMDSILQELEIPRDILTAIVKLHKFA